LSYDINFWKLECPIMEPPIEVYRRLSMGDSVSGLVALPIGEINARLQVAFPAYDPIKPFPSLQTAGGRLRFFRRSSTFASIFAAIVGQKRSRLSK
jgi:hypothetical protein